MTSPATPSPQPPARPAPSSGASPHDGANPRHGGRATFAATVGLVFGPSTILLFLFGVFVAPIEREFGWSRPAILTAITLVSLMIMVVSPIQGYLIDRFGTRPVVLWSTVPFAVGLAAMSQIGNDIRAFYVAYAMLPFLAIGLWPVSYLRVVSTWYDRRLGLATGIANGGIGIGAALLPVLATYLMTQGSWRTVFLALSVIVLVVTLPLNLWLLREAAAATASRDGRTQRSASPPAGLDFRSVLRTRSFRLLLAAFFVLGFVNTGLATNQISMLVDGGLTPARAAAVQSVFGLAVLFGRFLTGYALDHLPAKHLMSVVSVGGAIACLAYAQGPGVNTAFACAILIGAIYGAEFDVLSYVIKRYFGIAAFGRSYGVVFAVFQLGAAGGATVLPLSRAHLGSYAPGLWLYAGALALCAVLFLLLSPSRSAPAQADDAPTGSSGRAAGAA